MILQVLSVTNDVEFHQGYKKLISEINKPDTKYLLRLANRLFGETSYEFISVSYMVYNYAREQEVVSVLIVNRVLSQIRNAPKHSLSRLH